MTKKIVHDYEYLRLLKDVLDNGVVKKDRTGTGTLSVFSREMRFDLSDGSIPLLTTKKMHTKSIIHELLWFLSGDTNIKYLNDNGVKIWNNWANSTGDLGPVYPAMWRRWNCGNESTENIDQISNIIETLKIDPDDRRLIVDSWNPSLLPDNNKSFEENIKNNKQALPPCHYAFQFYVSNGMLSLKLNMRSNDLFLGNPFNIAQYSILLHMISHVTNLKPGEFIYSGGDIHIYLNHIEQCKQQLMRKPYPSPKLLLNENINNIDEFKYNDFEIIGYESHPTIKAPISV